ncbi:sugar phosphate isomerase/epimerase family protein [Ralstonia pseudosolanacearum]|uniref:Sugar phosphate isomerase/epimerase n=1 Tax=Ralstonia solanacearum TaxID=305 RepID=A0AA92JZK4_RALSL|nr:sugar phosphate isomerase/epimerase [Ralstonia pseudosolanacearum]QOK95766.1 sugar phosphate isomerase/epimerase [Ralstonia pseudosolanacearum]
MKIALDPYMHRHLPLPELCRKTAELGYEYIELSPRADFLEWWAQPRVYPERLQSFKCALKEYGVKLATLQPMYRWSSPLEDERQIAMRYWKRAIEVAVEMECDTMISEFGRGASPERSNAAHINTREACEAAFWRSMDELVPIFEREGVTLSIEPHPEDWIETFQPALDIIRSIHSPRVRMSYIAPHTFFYGDDMAAMITQAAPVLAHVRVADTFNHKKSSQLRYIVNPPGANVRVHQHLDIGQGEIDWDVFFAALADIGFDGVLSSCVFGWEERADDSSRFMRQEIQRYVDRYWKARPLSRPLTERVVET